MKIEEIKHHLFIPPNRRAIITASGEIYLECFYHGELLTREQFEADKETILHGLRKEIIAIFDELERQYPKPNEK